MLRIHDLEGSLTVPSPLIYLRTEWSEAAKLNLFIKRDELIDPYICGNKWRKLKYALRDIIDENKKGIITPGGAYSNHLIAVASAAHRLDIPSVGIIRSHHPKLRNPIMDQCRAFGMKLYFVRPSQYRLKTDSEMIQDILSLYPDFAFLPEGGSGQFAMPGVAEMIDEIREITKQPIDAYICAVGSGGMLAGIANAMDANSRVIGIAPFKGSVTSLAGLQFIPSEITNWEILPTHFELRFGAYDFRIVTYIKSFYLSYKILLDPIYTARAMMTLESLCRAGRFEEGQTVVFIHSGGLQGIHGYNYQYAKMNTPIPIEWMERSAIR